MSTSSMSIVPCWRLVDDPHWKDINDLSKYDEWFFNFGGHYGEFTSSLYKMERNGCCYFFYCVLRLLEDEESVIDKCTVHEFNLCDTHNSRRFYFTDGPRADVGENRNLLESIIYVQLNHYDKYPQDFELYGRLLPVSARSAPCSSLHTSDDAAPTEFAVLDNLTLQVQAPAKEFTRSTESDIIKWTSATLTAPNNSNIKFNLSVELDDEINFDTPELVIDVKELDAPFILSCSVCWSISDQLSGAARRT